jgi:hypothetical protein
MTREDIIRMAKEAGFCDWKILANEKQLKWFADLVAAAEREACAYRVGIALLHADRGLANRVDYAIYKKGAP